MTRYSPRTGLPTQYQVGPFDSAHWYVQWGGKLPGSEIWSCSLRMAFTGTGTADNSPSFATSVANAVSAFHTTAGSMIDATCKLSYCKVNVVGTDGHYISPTTQETVFADLAGPNSGGPLHPNQVALAVSWTTGVTRGPAHRGRFYLPMPSVVIGADTLVTTTARDSVKTRATALLTALNAIRTDAKVAVFSRKSGAATNRLVQGVEVGRVLDTVRRRRNKLAELY